MIPTHEGFRLDWVPPVVDKLWMNVEFFVIYVGNTIDFMVGERVSIDV